VPGHIQRGGSPSAYDRVLSTRVGVHAAQMIRDKTYGMAVGLCGDDVTHHPLAEVAGKTKLVPPGHQMVEAAREMGVCMGD
jgi:6-phosphofructokinase 1